MAARFYFIPTVGAGVKYLNFKGATPLAGLEAIIWHSVPFGPEPVRLVVADVQAAEHTILNAQADVTSIPSNIDQQVGAQLAAVQAALEALNIPALWVNATMTYRQVLRVIVGFFQLLERFNFLMGGQVRLFGGAVTLDSTMSSLPERARLALIQAADDLRLDRNGITAASTVRQVLKIAGDQWGDRPIFMMLDTL